MKNRLELLTVIDELEYIPLSTLTEELVHHAISKSMLELGKTGSRAVTHYICSIHGFSENELLTNFDLFEKSISESLGSAASNIILLLVKKELLRNTVLLDPTLTVQDILNPDLSIRDIITRLNQAEILKFVNNIPKQLHSICLYKTQTFRDRVISTFFQGKGISNDLKLYITTNKSCLIMPDDVECITYKELSEKPSRMVDNFLNLIACPNTACHGDTPRPKSSAITIAAQNDNWWLKNGYAEQAQILEETLGRNFNDKISVLCAFDISELGHKEMGAVMRNIIRCHSLVIIEDPPGLYGPHEHKFLKNLLREESSFE